MAQKSDIRGRRLTALISTTAAVALLGGGAANAQAPAGADPASVTAPTTVEDIIVTGSRARSAFSAPTPTQVMGAEELAQRGATNIAAIINEIPAFGTKNTNEGNGGRPSTTGQNFADLRGLGSFRTLVLVDGLRFVPQVPASNITNPYQVDLNVIPSLMTERVEVVTGGASAQWGSDAVAGVMNIILRKRMDGLQGEAQYGVSQRGDGQEYRLGLVGGRSFAEDRGHIVLSGDYVRNKGVPGAYPRGWAKRAAAQATNASATAANGLPRLVTVFDGQFGNRTPGGLITAVTGSTAAQAAAMSSLIGREFLAGGATRTFQRGLYNTDATITGTTTLNGRFQAIQSGGLYPEQLTNVDLLSQIERKALYGRGEYELTDRVTMSLSASYADSKGYGTSSATTTTDTGGAYNPTTGVGSQARIYADNPYIPDSLRALIPAPTGVSTATPPAQSFLLGRVNYDFGDGLNTVRNKVYTTNFVLEGDLDGGWSWDAAATYGHNKYVRTSTLQRNRAAYALASDAIRNPTNPSQIICRSTLTSPNNGCVPANLMGAGSPSQAAIDYFTDTVFAQNIYKQKAAQANLRGEPVSTWAGPVSVAAGLEWRSETIAVTSDALTPTGVYDSTGSTDPFSGKFNVKEGYVEAVAPLAKDQPWARSLAVNGVVRYADYSNFGGATTWKVGSTYEPPIEGLLLRAAYSKDLRAPSLYELYLPTTTNFLSTPFRGVTYNNIRSISSGNPNLEGETGKTLTVGSSWSPSFIPGLRMSLDFYKIRVTGAIGLVGGTNVALACDRGDTSFCSSLIFATPGNPATALVGINDQFINFSEIKTSGRDFTVSYDTDFLAGRLTLRGSTAFVSTFKTISPGVAGAPDTIREFAGGVGSGNSSAFPVPKWKAVGSATYSQGPFSVTGQVRYVGAGRQSTILTETPSATAPRDIAPGDNSIPAFVYLNLSGTYDFRDEGRAQFFWVINNVLDKDPPAIPNTIIQIQTNGSNYDTVGRYFRVGLRFKL